MRISPFLLALTVISSSASGQRAAAPCTKATAACTRWITWGAGPSRSRVLASYPLDKANPAITRAFIMVHGAGRNWDHYFETSTGAGFLAGALENTIIIAPRFAASNDTVAANEIKWPERGDNWRSGGMSPTSPTISSFDFVDEIVRTLANKKLFPNLTKIVVAGHSAGGQYVARYQMTSKAYGTPGVAVSYVIANPSSYAWPSVVRPLPAGDANPVDAYKEALGEDGEKVHTNFTFGPFDSSKAPNFNRWPAGLENRSGYTAGMTDEQIRQNLATRPVTILLGQVDVLPLGGFDSSPNAMAQGPTRRARGEAYAKFITDSLGAKPNTIIVSECGHNDRCIFTTDAVFPSIFPR